MSLDKKKQTILALAHPPDYLVGMIATRGYWPGVRQLLGIAFRIRGFARDGSLPVPGFDPATSTLFRPSADLAGLLASLPERPDQDDARAAKDRLFDVVSDFPFASDDDKAVWLAALLTAVQRPAIPGAVPGIVLNGNKAGTGKGLLIDVVGITESGTPIPTRPYPKDPAEAAKVTLSLALAGVTAVHFDNLTTGRYGSSELDSASSSSGIGPDSRSIEGIGADPVASMLVYLREQSLSRARCVSAMVVHAPSSRRPSKTLASGAT